MAAKTRRELEQRLQEEQAKLAALESAHRVKLNEAEALAALASASLAAVDVDDLDTEARRQATAKVEHEAAVMAAGELARRIGEQRGVIAALSADVLRVDRAEVAAEGAALAGALRADLERLLPRFEQLTALSTRHQALDAKIENVVGFAGRRVECGELEQFGQRLAGFLQNERDLARFRAHVAADAAVANRRVAEAEAKEEKARAYRAAREGGGSFAA
jgi:hypothetical protein